MNCLRRMNRFLSLFKRQIFLIKWFWGGFWLHLCQYLCNLTNWFGDVLLTLLCLAVLNLEHLTHNNALRIIFSSLLPIIEIYKNEWVNFQKRNKSTYKFSYMHTISLHLRISFLIEIASLCCCYYSQRLSLSYMKKQSVFTTNVNDFGIVLGKFSGEVVSFPLPRLFVEKTGARKS